MYLVQYLFCARVAFIICVLTLIFVHWNHWRLKSRWKVIQNQFPNAQKIHHLSIANKNNLMLFTWGSHKTEYATCIEWWVSKCWSRRYNHCVFMSSYPALCCGILQQVTTSRSVNYSFLLCSREPICPNGIQNCIGTPALTFQLQSCVQDTHTDTNKQEGLQYDSRWRVLAGPWAESQRVTQHDWMNVSYGSNYAATNSVTHHSQQTACNWLFAVPS